jgi:hypothetical protein
MQRLDVSDAVRPLKWPLGVKWLTSCVSNSSILWQLRSVNIAVGINTCILTLCPLSDKWNGLILRATQELGRIMFWNHSRVVFLEYQGWRTVEACISASWTYFVKCFCCVRKSVGEDVFQKCVEIMKHVVKFCPLQSSIFIFISLPLN